MMEMRVMKGRALLGVLVIDELRLCYLAEPSLFQELASIPQTVDVLLDLKFLAEYILIYPTSVLLLSPKDRKNCRYVYQYKNVSI